MKQEIRGGMFGDYVRCKTDEVSKAKNALLEQMIGCIRELAQREDFWIVKPACEFDGSNPFSAGKPIEGEATVAWKIFFPQIDEAASTYKTRMQREYHELNVRYHKLSDMLERYATGILDFTLSCSYELLHEQLKAMEAYRNCLETRAKIENIDLREVTVKEHK